MSITGKEARERILTKIHDLKRLSDECSAILEELPIPTTDEFAAMRSGRIPWTAEAYFAALIRNADFLVNEAETIIHDYSPQTDKTLKSLWKRKGKPLVPLERSLRYLVQSKSGTRIPPSKEEELYYDPFARAKAALRLLIDLDIPPIAPEA